MSPDPSDGRDEMKWVATLAVALGIVAAAVAAYLWGSRDSGPVAPGPAAVSPPAGAAEVRPPEAAAAPIDAPEPSPPSEGAGGPAQGRIVIKASEPEPSPPLRAPDATPLDRVEEARRIAARQQGGTSPPSGEEPAGGAKGEEPPAAPEPPSGPP